MWPFGFKECRKISIKLLQDVPIYSKANGTTTKEKANSISNNMTNT